MMIIIINLKEALFKLNSSWNEDIYESFIHNALYQIRNILL